MKKSQVIFSVLFILCSIVLAEEPRKTDCPGGQDYTLVPRYENAVMQCFEKQDFSRYVLGIAVPVEKNVRNHGKYFSEYLDLEGTYTRIQYIIDPQEGLYKVKKSYHDFFVHEGFNLLFETDQNECEWPFWNEDVYNRDGGINAIKGNFYVPSGQEGFYYLAVSRKDLDSDVYCALFISYANEYGKKFILVSEDIIECKSKKGTFESNISELPLLKSNEIGQKIMQSGHAALGGIYFDTGSSEISEKSEEAIKNIANFLNKNPDNLFIIVGHTDSKGDFNENISLSKQRAYAVVQMLFSKYMVKKSQIIAYGAGCCCPVATNETEKGRAANRRVEIVQTTSFGKGTIEEQTDKIISQYKKVYPEYIKLKTEQNIMKNKLKTLMNENMGLKRELEKLKAAHK